LAHLRRLKYVNSYVDRHGRARHYFRRRKGEKQVPLPGPFGSDEFMRSYQMALMGADDAAASSPPSVISAGPGTVNALVFEYYRSAKWLSLDEETRKTRRRIIENWRESFGACRVATLQRKVIEAMIGKVEGASAKRSFFKTIRPLLQHAVPTMLKDDPTAGIPTPKLPKSKGHHTWTDAEIAQYRARWPCGTQQRLVFEFALETVSRRGEVVRLGPQHIYGGRIRIARIHGSKDVDIPVAPELMAAIDAMPKAHLTFIVTAYGKPRSKFGLGTDFAGWARAAGLPDRCRLHGLKKAGMTRLADDGATVHEIMAVSGHRTLAEVERYTKEANDKLLATSAMAKRGRGQSANGQGPNREAQGPNRIFKPLK
jgi:integrase